MSFAWPFSRRVPGLLLLLIPALAAQAGLLVSAAISLKAPLEEAAALYLANHGVQVQLNLGASGDLMRQIQAGAPVDLFISASSREMDLLDAEGLVARDSRVELAYNRVVLITPIHGPPLRQFADLRRPDVKRVALGNPATVPAGQYARAVLDHLGLSTDLKTKEVLAAHARQVVDWVARGEVEAGIVYETEALRQPHQVRVVCEAPRGSHPPPRYPAARVKASSRGREAQGFLDFLSGKEGRRLFTRHGFLPPKKALPQLKPSR